MIKTLSFRIFSLEIILKYYPKPKKRALKKLLLSYGRFAAIKTINSEFCGKGKTFENIYKVRDYIDRIIEKLSEKEKIEIQKAGKIYDVVVVFKRV